MCSRRLEQGDRALASLEEDGAGGGVQIRAGLRRNWREPIATVAGPGHARRQPILNPYAGAGHADRDHDVAHSLVVIDGAMALVGTPGPQIKRTAAAGSILASRFSAQ